MRGARKVSPGVTLGSVGIWTSKAVFAWWMETPRGNRDVHGESRNNSKPGPSGELTSLPRSLPVYLEATALWAKLAS